MKQSMVKISIELAAACGLETKARRTGHEGTGREVVREREEGDLAALSMCGAWVHGEQG